MNSKMRNLSRIFHHNTPIIINLKNLKMKKKGTLKIPSSLCLKAGVLSAESKVLEQMLICLVFSVKKTVLNILELSRLGTFSIGKQSSLCLPHFSFHRKQSKPKMPICSVQCLNMALISFVKISAMILNNFVLPCF